MKKKNKKWIKFRHGIVRNVLNLTLGVYTRIKYHVRIEKFKEQKRKQAYLILFNHQTAFDQFFVGMSFKGPVYYLASEDLFSNGWVSSLIKYLVAPIPIKKQTTDIKAILNCIKVSREGGTIAIAPEGNRTYSGKTEYMSPSIAPLAKKLGLPIALYRIEGGYGVHPRWSDVVRKGKMRCYVSRVIEPDEYQNMTDEELFSVIEKGIYVNEAVDDCKFTHKKQAEYLERAIFVCPKCGFSTFESSRDILKCKSCEVSCRHMPDKTLLGVGCDLPFKFVNDWYQYQKDFVNSYIPSDSCVEPLYNEICDLYEEIPYKCKNLISKGAKIKLFPDKITVDTENDSYEFSFDNTPAVTLLGRNKLNIYNNGHIYQIKSSKRFCALKYLFLFTRYKNTKKGETNAEFLGL